MYSLGYEFKGLSLNNDSEINGLMPLQRVDHISHFDFDTRNDFIYIADSERGEIQRIKRDGSERKVILEGTESYESHNDWLGGIAVDWIAGNIYWTDQKRGLIEMSNSEGEHRRVISSQVFKPYLIEVDPLLGVLFFVDGANRIIRRDLDGGNSLFVSKNSSNIINDITLDTANQNIYVCESKGNKIWKVEYDGNGRRDLEIADVVNPTSLDIVDDTLYWVERGVGAIKSLKLDIITEPVTIKTSIALLQNLRIFSTKKQHGTNPCHNNGDCEEICLFNGMKGNCYCSHGFPDPKDPKRCKNYENLLFYSRKNSIEKVDHSNKNNSVIQNQYLQNAVALSYDFKHQIIFYSDLKLNAIFSCTFDGKNFTKLIDKQNSVEGIVFNSQDNKIYWTLNGDAEIRSADMSLWTNGTIVEGEVGKFFTIQTVLKMKKGYDKLRAIVVEPCLAMLYFSNWNSKDPSISRIYTSGYGRERLITKDIFMPNGLAIDFIDKKIFWADARLDKVEKCDYDGSNRVVLAQTAPKHPFSIAVLGDFIFWTDWILHGVLRANKYSENDVIFIKRDIEQPMGLFVAQDPIKNCTNNACAAFNGGCEDICLPHGDANFKCECSQGILDKDQKKCISRSKIASCDTLKEFECKSGECVPYVITCDGIPHCSDGSDESLIFCATRKCPEENFFQCRNFRCILKNETCNGHPDCEDGSDEEKCECTSDQFKCKSGECIARNHVCDYDADCKDATDEMNCGLRDCSGVLADHEGFKPDLKSRLIPCPNTTACYMKEWECDGKHF